MAVRMNRRVGLAGLIFAVAFAIYWGTVLLIGDPRTPPVAYFDQLADAFLQGRLYLANPPEVHDLTQFDGRWYVPFPPLPALLLTPWVALAGLARTNTVLMATLLGAANVTLVFLLLESLSDRSWSRLDTRGNLWLALLFGLGSVHWYMATLGSVWFVAQITTVTFVALAAWLAAATGSAGWSGLALALAMLARPNVALAWPLLLGMAAQGMIGADGSLNRRRLARWVAVSALPMAAAVAGLLLYNWARFGHALDFGYATANVAAKLVDDLRTYGQFSLHYVARNFWAMALALPRWDARAGLWLPDPEGMSLLLTTPALVYLVKARRGTPLVIGAWLAVGLLLVPLVLYYNTGWYQFGYRFSLDFMVPVMALLAVAAGERVSWPLRGLILAGVAVNLAGVLWWHGGG